MEILRILWAFGCTNIKNYLDEYIDYLLAAIKITNVKNSLSIETKKKNIFFFKFLACQ